jgi:hypothetical protein
MQGMKNQESGDRRDLARQEPPLSRKDPSYVSPVGDRVAIPFMVREPHHERNCLIENSSTYPFALSASKGSERIATQSLARERREGLSAPGVKLESVRNLRKQ